MDVTVLERREFFDLGRVGSEDVARRRGVSSGHVSGFSGGGLVVRVS